MRQARSAIALSALCLAGFVVGGCSSEGADSTASSPTSSTTAPRTTTPAKATVGDPLAVTCGQYTDLDKASQLQVIVAVYGNDPAKNDDRVSMVDLLCMSDLVRDKPVKDAMPQG
ncbi:hypothetical protein [Nocardia sp. NPDC058666]|uniref:hypothetical protein n=1 Tax=Nocardia sp. NPDC058666 TaxID=3346587 RepID=UPI00364C3C36